MLILDQCLTDPAISFNDIYQIVDDPVFQPHHDIQIPQPDIGIDQNHLFIHTGKPRSDVRCRRRLSDSAFSGCNYDNLTHIPSLRFACHHFVSFACFFAHGTSVLMSDIHTDFRS